jgi:hypothetical protein
MPGGPPANHVGPATLNSISTPAKPSWIASLRSLPALPPAGAPALWLCKNSAESARPRSESSKPITPRPPSSSTSPSIETPATLNYAIEPAPRYPHMLTDFFEIRDRQRHLASLSCADLGRPRTPRKQLKAQYELPGQCLPSRLDLAQEIAKRISHTQRSFTRLCCRSKRSLSLDDFATPTLDT